MNIYTKVNKKKVAELEAQGIIKTGYIEDFQGTRDFNIVGTPLIFAVSAYNYPDPDKKLLDRKEVAIHAFDYYGEGTYERHYYTFEEIPKKYQAIVKKVVNYIKK